MEGGQATKVLEDLSNYLNLAIVDEGIYFVPQQGMASELFYPISGLRD